MKTFVQPGETITIASPAGGNLSGDFINANGIRGVALNTALVGANSPVLRDGVHLLPKAAGTAWVQGQSLYFDAVAKAFTTVAAGNLAFGLAAAAALSADTTGQVLLAPAFRSVGGQVTTVAASDTIVTGLSKVIAVVANLEDAPVIGCDRAQGVIGDQAGAPASGSILIKTFKPTASGDATPVAATTFGKKVNWLAVGY
jgi:predicted RecA/RadA family phage recombinase